MKKLTRQQAGDIVILLTRKGRDPKKIDAFFNAVDKIDTPFLIVQAEYLLSHSSMDRVEVS